VNAYPFTKEEFIILQLTRGLQRQYLMLPDSSTIW